MLKATCVMLLLVFLSGILLLSPERAWACSCMTSPPLGALDRAAAVFAGTVVNIKLAAPMWMQDSVQVTLEVSRVWKGPIRQQVTIATASSSASCGYEFRAGGEYLVYAGGDQEHLSVSQCSRTNWLSAAKADLDLLGVARLPSPTSVSAAANDAFGLAIPILAVGLAVGLAIGVGLTVLVSRMKAD